MSDGKLSAEEYEQKLAALNAVIEAQKGKVWEMSEAQQALNASWEYGAASALQRYQDELGNVAQTMEQAVTRAFRGMEDSLVNFVKTGKLDFKSLADSIISDIIRIQIQRSIITPLVGTGKEGDNGLLGGLMKAIGLHSGGIVGREATFMRAVDTSAFIGAPRYHTGGIAGDEVPAILRRGEGVFTPEQMAALGSGSAPQVAVNVINQSGTSVDARQQGGPRFDGEQFVVDVVLSRAGSDPNFRAALGMGR